jgi:hypothetical protein
MSEKKQEVKKFKMKYKGDYAVVLMSPCYVGKVLPGEIIEVDESTFNERKNNKSWEPVKSKKESK